VSGALTERDFVHKLEKAGFTDIEIVERTAMGVADCALYPLFTEDLLGLMRTLLPPDRQDRVATAIVLTSRRAE
jgi:arsenite methyltransferase